MILFGNVGGMAVLFTKLAKHSREGKSQGWELHPATDRCGPQLRSLGIPTRVPVAYFTLEGQLPVLSSRFHFIPIAFCRYVCRWAFQMLINTFHTRFFLLISSYSLSLSLFFFFTIFKVFIEFVTILHLFWFLGGKACGILAPWPGIEPAPPALEGGAGYYEIITIGLPGESPFQPFLKACRAFHSMS